MKKILFASLLLTLSLSCGGQKLIRYNHSDTLIEMITLPFFVSEKLVHFDSTYILNNINGNSTFKIGKVCDQFGCDGDFSTTGKIQSGWWLLENKIIICYLTPTGGQSFRSELKVWKYNHKTKRFVLIL